MQNYKNVNAFKRTFYPLVHRLSEASLRVKMFAHSHCAMNNGYSILNNCNPSNSHFQAAKFSVYDLMTHLEILFYHIYGGNETGADLFSQGPFVMVKQAGIQIPSETVTIKLKTQIREVYT